MRLCQSVINSLIETNVAPFCIYSQSFPWRQQSSFSQPRWRENGWVPPIIPHFFFCNIVYSSFYFLPCFFFANGIHRDVGGYGTLCLRTLSLELKRDESSAIRYARYSATLTNISTAMLFCFSPLACM